jgi:hypothetical protein
MAAAAGLALLLSQCIMLVPRSTSAVDSGTARSPASPADAKPGLAPGKSTLQPIYNKGAIVVIRGLIRVDRGTVYLDDDQSNAVFVFVGLGRPDAAALTKLQGKHVQIRLKVVSANEGNRFNANFMGVVGAPQDSAGPPALK